MDSRVRISVPYTNYPRCRYTARGQEITCEIPPLLSGPLGRILDRICQSPYPRVKIRATI